MGTEPLPDNATGSQDARGPERWGAADAGRRRSGGRDTLSSIVLGLALLWAGLIFLGETLGLLDALSLGASRSPFGGVPLFMSGSTWRLLFAGLGVLFALEAVVRLAMPAYRAGIVGTVIAAAVMFVLAFGDILSLWPLILVAVGVAILLRGLVGRRA